MSGNSRAVQSYEERIRFTVAVSLRALLMWRYAYDPEYTVTYDALRETLGIDRQRLDDVLSMVMEMDVGMKTFLHGSMVVNAETGKPGKGHWIRLQEISERVAQALAQEAS